MSCAEMLRETIDCNAVPKWQATRMGSMPCCGCAPCAPLPVIVMSKNAPPAARAWAGDEPADRQAGPVVHAVDEIAGETLEQAVLQHLQRTANAFLGRLEDEVDGAVEVAGLRQVLRRAEQHGGVAVMAAGMHAAGVLAGVRQAGRLQDRQRVHIGAQSDRGLAVAVAQHANDAGLADAAMHLDAPFLQLARDEIRGAVFLQPEFGMGVDVSANSRQLRLEGAGAIERGLGHDGNS